MFQRCWLQEGQALQRVNQKPEAEKLTRPGASVWTVQTNCVGLDGVGKWFQVDT